MIQKSKVQKCKIRGKKISLPPFPSPQSPLPLSRGNCSYQQRWSLHRWTQKYMTLLFSYFYLSDSTSHVFFSLCSLNDLGNNSNNSLCGLHYSKRFSC